MSSNADRPSEAHNRHRVTPVPTPDLPVSNRHGRTRRLRPRKRFRLRRAPLKIYGNIGSLEVRLARTNGDVRRAQRLRFQVFYKEMSAVANPTTLLKRRDIDGYDSVCDHLLVVDHGAGHRVPTTARFASQIADHVTRRLPKRWQRRRPRIVGTYRMLRQDVAERHSGFYTQNEFDLAPLIAARGPDCKFLELGRSCVLQPYRNRRTVELLWHGLWTYIREHGISVMVGCASFEGTDPTAHAKELSFLHHHVMAPKEWRVTAHPHLRVDMDMMPAKEIKPREVMRALPPLIKGYLRLGCFVGDGAVVDHQFGTTDVLMILPVEKIDPRYFAHFGTPDEQTARIHRGAAANA